MRRFLLSVIFIFPLLSWSQVAENFSDGDFISNPAWAGDAGKWQVIGGQLQSGSAVANDTFYLSTASTSVIATQWEWWMKLDFSTSGNNYVDIYLVSSQADLKGPLNGYFVRVGGTPDEISLYRKDGVSITRIIDGVDGRSQQASSNNLFKIKVICTASNEWKLYNDLSGSGSNYFLEGTVTDATHTTGNYFGISVKQSTSSFFNRHYFDDIYAGAIIPDTTRPVISAVQVISAAGLDVQFSEGVEQATAQAISNYVVSNSIGSPVTALRDGADFSLVHLTFTSAFTPSLANTITINNVADMDGNIIKSNSTSSFTYYLPQAPSVGDIVFNEVLFNAKEGGSEFVEIYNNSQKVIDLKNVQIAKVNLETNVMGTPAQLSLNNFYFLPGKYLVLTDDSSKVKNQYITSDPDAFLEMNLPDLLTSEDIVVLIDQSQNELDKLHYYEDWHYPLLTTFDGISLERISFYEPTNMQSNWHSASQPSGFATPGYQNSQFVDGVNDGSEVTISPEIFSPDNDGYNDVMNLNYTFSTPGFVANATVFDSRGRFIKKIADNLLLGTSGSIFWDGISDENMKARTGIYVVFLEVFSSAGEVKKYKRTCVLATKL